MSIIANYIFDIQHLCNIQNDSSSHNASKSINKISQSSPLTITAKLQWKLFINKIKRKHNTFTLLQLKKWDEWNTSIFKQLDQYYDQHTFDKSEPLPPEANLLSLCWVYLIKLDGFNTKKARCVCNGLPRFGGTVTLAETYASALDQTGTKMFWAVVAINKYRSQCQC